MSGDLLEMPVASDQHGRAALYGERDEVIVAHIVRHNTRRLDRVRVEGCFAAEAAHPGVDVSEVEAVLAGDARMFQSLRDLPQQLRARNDLEGALQPGVQDVVAGAEAGQRAGDDDVGVEDGKERRRGLRPGAPP